MCNFARNVVTSPLGGSSVPVFVALLSCDGSEAERYSNIYQDLIAGEKECMDSERPLTPEMEEMLMKMFATA